MRSHGLRDSGARPSPVSPARVSPRCGPATPGQRRARRRRGIAIQLVVVVLLVVVVVTVRLPAEFPVRADVAVPAEGRPSDSGVAPAARAALTAFAMATAPLCASFAPA